MNITEKEAFRLGFLARCAEEKLIGAELDTRLNKVAALSEKTAQNPLFNIIPASVDPVEAFKALGTGAKAMLGLPFAASILAGGGLGYGTARMLEPKIDEDEIKAQELAATYKLYADKAKNRKKIRQYRLGQSDL